MGMFDWAKATGNFAVGFATGVKDFAVSTAVGLKDSAVAGYHLATDPAYREQAWQTTKALAKATQKGAQYAYNNPQEALNKVRDKASGAYADFQAEREQARADGRLAEFDGHLLGRLLPELIPISKLAKISKLGEVGKIGKVAEVVADGSKLKKAEALVETTQTTAKKVRNAIAKAKVLPACKPGAVAPCAPVKASTKPKSALKKPGRTGKNKAGKASQPLSETRTAAEPVSMVTGEELLALDDFTWAGPLPLTWTRLYRSGQSGVDLQLGHGWLTPLDEWLDLDQDQEVATFHDREGRSVDLALPAPGGHSLHRAEQLRLYRDGGLLRLVAEDGPDRIFADNKGHCPLLRWQNDAGQAIHLARDASGQVQALVASWGPMLVLQRRGRHLVAIGPGQRTGNGFEPTGAPHMRYLVDAAGDLAATLNRLDQGERYAYNQHLLVGRTLASGFSFYFEWDALAPTARCMRSRGDGGIYDTRFEWQAGGVSRAIDSRGGIAEYVHDDNALLLRQTTPEGRCTQYHYDDDLLLRQIIDPAGQATQFAYDSEGRLLAATDPLGHTSKVAYDAAGRANAYTDALGHTWRRSHDDLGRIVQTQDPLGGRSQISYNTMGLPSQVSDALGRNRTLLWDEQARLVGDIGFDGQRQSYQYGEDDRIVTVITQNRRRTRYQYDALGRTTAIEGPDGATVRLQYNALGLLTRHTDAAGRITEYRYADGLNEPTERVTPDGQRLRYQYDSERNLVGLVNAKGEAYRLAYDRDENLIEEIGFDGRVQRYAWGLGGALASHSQPAGEAWLKTRFERDPLGRLLKKFSPDGAVSEFSYDALGQLQDARNADGRVILRQDALGRLIEEGEAGHTVRHEYDALGRRCASVLPDGRCITTTWGANDRMAQVALDGQSLTRHRYDDLGQETARQQGAMTSRYAHDPAGRLLRQQAGLPGQPRAVLDRRYGYDVAGRLTAMDDLRQGAARYFYDPADRLLQVEGMTPESFGHDPAGNLLGSAEGAAAASAGRVEGDRLLMMGDRHFAYDAAGNLVQERRGNGGHKRRHFRYDSDSRLVEVATDQGITRYHYDALGRRIAKHGPQGETRFSYDGVRLLTERTAGRESLYLFEPDSFRPLVRVDRSGPGTADQVYHYHLDHLGTPREISDAAGHIVWSGRYRAYGALALADVALIDNPIRFQGQYFDAETGLHCSLHRYYDPEAGRFIHQDPIGLEGGSNVYQYAPNPVNWVDPLGLTAKGCGSASGQSARVKNPATRKSAHGNKVDNRPATLYEKYDKDGIFLKHGITKHENPSKRYTSRQIDGGTVVRTDRGPRNEMLKKERNLVETNPGPHNREPWAGKRRNK